VFWDEKQSEKLGGPRHTVEIDEMKMDKRKYNRSRLMKDQWIFGGYERDSKKIFIVPVEDRTEKTLLARNGYCQEQLLFQIVGSSMIV